MWKPSKEIVEPILARLSEFQKRRVRQIIDPISDLPEENRIKALQDMITYVSVICEVSKESAEHVIGHYMINPIGLV